VIVAFDKQIPFVVKKSVDEEPTYESALLKPEWLRLGGKPTILDKTVILGNPFKMQCKGCGTPARMDRLVKGYCARAKCSLQLTMEQKAEVAKCQNREN